VSGPPKPKMQTAATTIGGGPNRKISREQAQRYSTYLGQGSAPRSWVIGSDKLFWTRQNRSLALHFGKSGPPLVEVVPDLHHSGMFRVALPGGRFGDLANLTRAADAAVALALGALNRKEGQETGTDAPSIAQNGSVLGTTPNAKNNSPGGAAAAVAR
jgi:hypothetical protein